MVKTYTITGFAKKHKLSRATVWRWATDKKHNMRFKMYDARSVRTIDGKIIIEQTIQTKVTA